jgi:hypothetical protein
MRPTPRETRTKRDYREMATGRGKKSSPKGNEATRSGPDPRKTEAPPANTAVEPVTEALPPLGPETRALQEGHDSSMPKSQLPSIPTLARLQHNQTTSTEIIASSTQEEEARIELQRISQGPLTGEQDETASLLQNGQLEPNGFETPAPPSSTSSDKIASTTSSGTKRQKLKLNGPKPQKLRLTPPKKPIQNCTETKQNDPETDHETGISGASAPQNRLTTDGNVSTEPPTGDKKALKVLQQQLRDLRKNVTRSKKQFGDQQDLYRMFLRTLTALQGIEHESFDTLKNRNPSRISWLRGLAPSELQRTLHSVIDDVQEVKDRFGDRPELGDQLLDFLNCLQNLDDEPQPTLEKKHAERMRSLDALCSGSVSQEGAEAAATGSAPREQPLKEQGNKRKIENIVDAATDTIKPPRGKRTKCDSKEKTNETSDILPPRSLEVGPTTGIISSFPGVLNGPASSAQLLKATQKGNKKAKRRTAKTPIPGPSAAVLVDPPAIQTSNCEEELGGQGTKRKVDDTIHDGGEPLPEQPQRKRTKRSPKAGLQTNNTPASGPSAVTGDDIATAPSPQALADSPAINQASAAQLAKKETKKQERKPAVKTRKELILKLPQGKKTKTNVKNTAAIAPSKLANAPSTDAEEAERHAAASALMSMRDAGPIYIKHREWLNPAPVSKDRDSPPVVKGKNSRPAVKGRKSTRVIKGREQWDEHAITDPDLLRECPSLEFLNAPPPKDEYRPTYHKNCNDNHTTCKSYPPRKNNNRRGSTINKVTGQVIPEPEVLFTTSPVPRRELNPKEKKSREKAVNKMITAGIDTDKNYPPYVEEPVQDSPSAAPAEVATGIPSDAVEQPHVDPTESDEEAARDMQQLTDIIADIHRRFREEKEELQRQEESRSKVEAWLPSVPHG